MYDVDERDHVTELVEVPASSAGSPTPLVLSDEHRAVLAYHVHETESWDGEITPEVDELIAIVRFTSCYAQIGWHRDRTARTRPRRQASAYGAGTSTTITSGR